MQTKIKSSDSSVDSESGMVVERRFTSAGQDPFDSFEWIEMDVQIRNPDGSMADSLEGVKLPSGFSGVPGTVCAQKYLCLLYTSPSPRDATLSRMPSSA